MSDPAAGKRHRPKLEDAEAVNVARGGPWLRFQSGGGIRIPPPNGLWEQNRVSTKPGKLQGPWSLFFDISDFWGKGFKDLTQ
jgi:hypothetical protein